MLNVCLTKVVLLQHVLDFRHQHMIQNQQKPMCDWTNALFTTQRWSLPFCVKCTHCSASYCAVYYISHRARTSFYTCLWETVTWARRRPRGTDWQLLCLHYPCSPLRTSPHPCLLTPCAAVKPAMRDGQCREKATKVYSILIYLFIFTVILMRFCSG